MEIECKELVLKYGKLYRDKAHLDTSPVKFSYIVEEDGEMHTKVEVIPAYIWEIAKSLTNSIIKDRLFSISEQETEDGYRVSGSIRFMATEKKYNEIMGSHGGQG